MLERTLEHEADGDTRGPKGESSHRQLHIRSAHPEVPEGVSPNTHFEMKVIKSHKTALARLVDEALTIRRAGSSALNLKEEYVRNPLPTISVRDPRVSPNGDPIKPPLEPPRRDLLEASTHINPWKRRPHRGEEQREGGEQVPTRREGWTGT